MRVRAPTCFLAGALGWAMLAPVAASAGEAPPAKQADDPLSAPGDYSLAPPALVQGGVVSTSIGSGGLRSSAVRLDTGLLGGGTRAFLLLGAGQGPHEHDRPAVSERGVAVGLETQLPHGTTLSLTAGHEQVRGVGFGAVPGGVAGAMPGAFGPAWLP